MLHICTVRSEIINWISLNCCCLSKALTLVQTTDLKGKLAKPNQHLKEFSSPLPLLESQPASQAQVATTSLAHARRVSANWHPPSLLSLLTWEPNLQSWVTTGFYTEQGRQILNQKLGFFLFPSRLSIVVGWRGWQKPGVTQISRAGPGCCWLER